MEHMGHRAFGTCYDTWMLRIGLNMHWTHSQERAKSNTNGIIIHYTQLAPVPNGKKRLLLGTLVSWWILYPNHHSFYTPTILVCCLPWYPQQWLMACPWLVLPWTTLILLPLTTAFEQCPSVPIDLLVRWSRNLINHQGQKTSQKIS